MADKANRLLSLNPMQNAIAAAVEPKTAVAAVSFPWDGRGFRGNQLRGQGSGVYRGCSSAVGKSASGVTYSGGSKQLISPHALAKDSPVLCFYYLNFKDNASKGCPPPPPCPQQGN